MVVLIDNNISVKKYNKISKYLEIEIEKMKHLKTISIPVIVGAIAMIKEETYKHMNKIFNSLGLHEI